MKIGSYMLTNKSWSADRPTPLGKYKHDYEKQGNVIKLTGCFIAPDRTRLIAVCKKSLITGITAVTINKAHGDKKEFDIPEIEAYMLEAFARVLEDLDRKEDEFQKELLLIGRKNHG